MAIPCGHPDPAATAAVCHLCRLATTRPDYARLWGGVTVLSPGPCVHLGAPTGNVVECPTCQGTVRLKLRACAVPSHPTCTEAKPVPGHACCVGCPDRRERPAPSAEPGTVHTRHLLYHLYPVARNGLWQWNVGELVKRLALFNGRRVIAVVTDPPGGRKKKDPTGRRVPGTDSLDAVKAAFGGHEAEFLHLENDPTLREVHSFLPLFSRVEEFAQPGHATLYAHAKQVTHSRRSPPQGWTEMLYATCLDYWPVVEEVLRDRPVAGPFLRWGRHWPASSGSGWAYSGSWFWFRNADLFRQPDWQRIDQFWSGIEPYPSLHFTEEEAGCFFSEGGPEMNLYDHGYFKQRAVPAFTSWKAVNRGRETGA